MKLSILICTINGRENSLKRILSILEKQKTNDIEILINKDNREKSVGEKRNELINLSKGKYICFIDDDDVVDNNYVEYIINCIDDSNPDVIGFELNYLVNGVKRGVAYHSLKYNSWYEEKNFLNDQMKYYRNPNHLNPVKRDIAKKVMFKEINFKEDYDYSMRMLPLLKTEEYIEKPIYTYLYNSKK